VGLYKGGIIMALLGVGTSVSSPNRWGMKVADELINRMDPRKRSRLNEAKVQQQEFLAEALRTQPQRKMDMANVPLRIAETEADAEKYLGDLGYDLSKSKTMEEAKASRQKRAFEGRWKDQLAKQNIMQGFLGIRELLDDKSEIDTKNLLSTLFPDVVSQESQSLPDMINEMPAGDSTVDDIVEALKIYEDTAKKNKKGKKKRESVFDIAERDITSLVSTSM
jgi:hypothetical protein